MKSLGRHGDEASIAMMFKMVMVTALVLTGSAQMIPSALDSQYWIFSQRGPTLLLLAPVPLTLL